METDLLAAAFEHDRAQVIGLEDAGHAAEALEGVDVAAKEAGESIRD